MSSDWVLMFLAEKDVSPEVWQMWLDFHTAAGIRGNQVVMAGIISVASLIGLFIICYTAHEILTSSRRYNRS